MVHDINRAVRNAAIWALHPGVWYQDLHVQETEGKDQSDQRQGNAGGFGRVGLSPVYHFPRLLYDSVPHGED